MWINFVSYLINKKWIDKEKKIQEDDEEIEREERDILELEEQQAKLDKARVEKFQTEIQKSV